MSQRVLVFEKSTNFLRELEAGFGRFGQQVEVATDVEAAVAAARAGTVSIVLVSLDAMSAPGEAFLVCKRFKSDDDLARIPFVLLGGPAHAESLASHRKLKRKADQYVEQPVTFESLLAQIEPVLPFDTGRGPSKPPESSSLDVDADIDAFADNAFDDLLLDDSSMLEEPAAAAVTGRPESDEPAFPVTRPQASAVDRGMERELSRLAAEVEELRTQAAAAEDRALASERRAKAAEASRPSVAPPPTGVSSRDYLDLREQLNRKDKELLSLRDEVVSRDRRLLDASDRALELERAQAAQEDATSTLQRQLEDAVSRVAGYEVDVEAAKKRRDELSSRLSRAEETVRSLERELDAGRAKHANEVSESKDLFEQHVRGLEEQAAADSARLRADHAAAVEKLSATHSELLSAEESRGRAEANELRAQHERASAERDAAHSDALQRAAQAHSAALEEQKNASDAAQASALAAAADDHAFALASAAAEQAERLEQRLSDSEAAKMAALEGQRSELEARFAGQAKEREDRHNKELAVLGRKLTEADTKAASLGQRIEELQRTKAELEQTLLGRIAALEADLGMRTEERDLTNNELSAARARIISFEQTEQMHTQRIAALEGGLFQAEQRIERQSSKIATDDQILERVRKALGISIGLLEQQRSNAPDN